MDLIIVESPHKAKTIEKYLGGKYKVDASGGHIRDLPEKRLGVDVANNYEPQYTINPDKKEVIKRLTLKASKADKVYLATDPDREGEAISWHLAHVLKMDNTALNRIEFNEISKSAVEKALQEPRAIKLSLVDAQQARRVLDRLVGYKLSPLLCKKIQSGLSAGRVQSVALKLVCDREREILGFKPEEYWTITAILQDKEKKYSEFKAVLSEKLSKKFKPTKKEEAEEVRTAVLNKDFIVKSLRKSVALSHAPAPFTTSTLQQDGSSKLSISSPQVMQIAQGLYEGVDVEGEGHIALVTYIRTDSVRISKEAQDTARAFIKNTYGAEFVPEKPNFYKSKKSAQDAHEAIRPIDLSRTPESLKSKLDRNHYRLYKLIYDRFLASQMSEAKYNSVIADLEADKYTFRATGKSLLFPGFTVIYKEFKALDDEADEDSKLLPPMEEGDAENLLDLKSEQKFTKPPARFTDASLVKTMEDKGIGRPSTYASIIAVLTKRNYTEKDGKYMKPTEVAFKITDMLVKYFEDIVETSFTAKMEDRLDEIEDGGVEWQSIVGDFYPKFLEKLLFANNDGDELTDEICEKCGAKMILKTGRYGKFLACSNYPECSNIKSSDEEISEVICEKCGANMIVRTGKYGKFLACPNYPDCSNIKPYGEEKSDVKCEECGGDMYVRTGKYGKYLNCIKCKHNQKILDLEGTCPICKKPTAKKTGKTGKIFYSCSGYPDCKFISWDVPTGNLCPKCNAFLVLSKDKKTIKCSNKECDYSEKVDE